MNTTVSYLVPSFNHVQYLPALLESIKADAASLATTWELIIVDDGSSDGSASLIQGWLAANLSTEKVITCFVAKNQGITATFNRLVDLSSGDYLRFCGSDDILVRASTTALLQAFAQQPGLACVFGDARVIDAGDGVVHASSIAFHGGRIARLEGAATLRRELIQHWCIAGPSMLIRRGHYATMRYDETLKIDDYDLILSLLENEGAVQFLNDVVCHYRIHATNTSKTRDRQKRIDNMRSFLFIVDKYIGRRTLALELIPVRHKTKAKLHFLTGDYVAAGAHALYCAFFRARGWVVR